MADSSYFYLPKAYIKIPTNNENASGTEHPELNSLDYIKHLESTGPKVGGFYPIYTNLDIFLDRVDDLFVLSSNDFTSAKNGGSLIAIRNFDTLIAKDPFDCSFSIITNSTITAQFFLNSSLFLVALKSGAVMLWDKNLQSKDCNVFRCGEAFTDGYVSNIAKLNEDTKFVVGTSKGHIDIFEYELSELIKSSSILYGHSSAITGVSSHPTSPKLFTTCSIDKNCLLWDHLHNQKASYLLRNYEHRLTAVKWTTLGDSKLIVLGDEIGNVLSIDKRFPNKILSKKRINNRSITNLCFNGTNKFGVVSKSNKAMIVEIDGSQNLETKYEHTADRLIYDLCWDKTDQKTFYVVGEQRLAETISMVE